MDASYTSRRGDCTTEFLTFASMQGEFRALNCELGGLSIDSTFSHIAWLRTIKEKVQFRHMKDVEVTFPVISDPTMDVSRLYGMLQPSASTTQALLPAGPRGHPRLIGTPAGRAPKRVPRSRDAAE